MAIASGITVVPLSLNTTAKTGYTHKVIVPYTAITAAAAATDTTATLALLDVTAGDEVRAAGFNLTTAFDASDTNINSLLIEVGDGSDTDRFIASQQLAADGTEITHWASNATTKPYAYTATDTIDALFTSAGSDTPYLDELNAGQVEVYLGVFNQNTLE